MAQPTRLPLLVPAVAITLGLLFTYQLLSALRLRATAPIRVSEARGTPAGQSVVIGSALLAFGGRLDAAEFNARDARGERHYGFVLAGDDKTDRKLPVLLWRTTFLGAVQVKDNLTRAEVRGTLRATDRALRERLQSGFPGLSAEDASLYLDDMEFPEVSILAVTLGLAGIGLIGYGLIGALKVLRAGLTPTAGLLPAVGARRLVATRTAEGRTQVRETRRVCSACGEESPSASRSCAQCKAPIEVEYFVSAAVPLDGFERLVPVVSQTLGVGEYQARQPLARAHTALPYQHLEGYHIKGGSASAPFRILGRGIPSLVTAQALGAALTEASVTHVIVGSDELARGPFPRPAQGLRFDDETIVFRFETGGGETEEREIRWNRLALVLFSADMPLRGTMTMARDVREGLPRDASSYVVDIYERERPEGVRVAESSFYHWEALKLGGSERPADRYGRLLDLIQAKCPSVETHYITGVYRGQNHVWRLNFLSRLSYVVGEKSGWLKQDGPPKLDGYEMLEKVGEGAMGAVYRARQKKLGRIVAVKVVAPHLAAEKNFLARFEAEARAVASLAHPNIVQVMDLTEWGGRFFMVMEFVEGETLQHAIRKHKRLPEAEAMRIGAEVAAALEHAAQRKIVHRDVKPENIFLTREGEVKLGDWGLAKDLGGDLSLTATGTAVGTPYYMSPEQARARKDLDEHSDFYSLGATIYHLVTGRPPFGGNSPTEVLMKHLTAAPQDPRKFTPDLSDEGAALLLRLLAKNPGDRYPPGAKVSAEFRRIRAIVIERAGAEVVV